MSALPSAHPTLAFVETALRQEGAEVEREGEGALFTLLPEPLASALGLPPAALLRVSGSIESDEVGCPLEGAIVQTLIDRALGRGRLAGVRLAARVPPAARRADATTGRLTLLNATLAGSAAAPTTTTVTVVEFAYVARSEERTEGVVAVAVPDDGGPPSVPLAEALLGHLGAAQPAPCGLDDAALSRAAAAAVPAAEAEVRLRLAPFLADRARRMAQESLRVAEYHDRLAREAKHARGRTTPEGIAGKRAAVERAREERLADVADRHAVDAQLVVDGLLVARYESVLVTLLVRRRKREVPVLVRWDPFLPEPLGPPCSACTRTTLSFHVCDEAAHLTCSACASPCPACRRVLCRACPPRPCGCA